MYAAAGGLPKGLRMYSGLKLIRRRRKSFARTSTRRPAGLTARTPAVTDSVDSPPDTADDTHDPGLTRPAGHGLTTFTPAIADSIGGSANTAAHTLDRGANHAARLPYSCQICWPGLAASLAAQRREGAAIVRSFDDRVDCPHGVLGRADFCAQRHFATQSHFAKNR